MDRRTVARKLDRVPPDGHRRGHPAWRLGTALPHLRDERRPRPSNGGARAMDPDLEARVRAMGAPFTVEDEPVTEAMAAQLIGVVYEAPWQLSAIAARVADLTMAQVYALHHIAGLALMGHADKEMDKLGLAWREADHFHMPLEPDWEALAKIKGEPVDIEAWKSYARTCLQQDETAG